MRAVELKGSWRRRGLERDLGWVGRESRQIGGPQGTWGDCREEGVQVHQSTWQVDIAEFSVSLHVFLLWLVYAHV